MAQISYAQALKNGIKKKKDKQTLNGPLLLHRLEEYYGGSATFLGKNTGLLSRIMEYRFPSCLGCNKSLNEQIVCQNCIETKMMEVDNKYLELCDSCNYCHTRIFEIECQVCKKNSNRMYNISGTDVCKYCIFDEDSDNDAEEDNSDYDNDLEEVD